LPRLNSSEHGHCLDYEEGAAIEDVNGTLLAIWLPGVLLPIHVSCIHFLETYKLGSVKITHRMKLVLQDLNSATISSLTQMPSIERTSYPLAVTSTSKDTAILHTGRA